MSMAASSSGASLWADPAMRVQTSAPPSSSLVTSSPVAAFTRGGPPVNMEAYDVMITKSLRGAARAPWPAEAPITRHTMGTCPFRSA